MNVTTQLPVSSKAMPPVPAKPKDIRSLLQSEDVRQKIALALPAHMKPDRMMRVALTAINKNPNLLDCTRESILSCLMQCSQFGLEPDGRHAHLIPYGKNCQLIFDYKGLLKLALQNGVTAKATEVCENDTFEVMEDDGEGNQKVVHKVDYRKPRGEVYAVYSRSRVNGVPDYEVMQKDQIEAVRKRSRAANNGPWVTDWTEMAKKTVLRRHSKRWPLDPEIAEAFTADDDTPDFRPGTAPKKPVFTAPFVAANAPFTAVDDAMPSLGEEAAEVNDAPAAEQPSSSQEEEQEVTQEVRAPKDKESGHAALEKLLADNGYSYPLLQKWAVQENFYPNADSYGSLEEVPDKAVTRLLAAKKGLLAALKEEKAKA